MRIPKFLSSRNFYSAIPLMISFILMYQVDSRSLYLIPLLIAALWWYFFGVLYFVGASFFLLYHRVGGLIGISAVALVFLGVVTSRLDRERAPPSDYAAVTAAILLSIPTYYLLLPLSSILSGFEATLLAVALFASLYFFIKAVSGD